MRRQLVPALLLAAAVLSVVRADAQRAPATRSSFTLDQVTQYPFPNELNAASRASRIVWALNERGVRNLFVAEGPAFTPRRLTNYADDDGQELTSVQLSPDGRYVVYVRGGDHGSNFDDALPVNPLGLPTPVGVQMWSVPFDGGEPRSLGEGEGPVVSPVGDQVAFERGNQLWVVPIDGAAPARRLFTARGSNGSPVWSPTGDRLAFVSNRGDHAYVGVYRGPDTPITYVAPSTHRDGSPRWSPDGSQLVFVRRVGGGGAAQNVLEQRPSAWALWTASATSGEARLLWTSPNTLRGSVPNTHGGTNLHWAAGGRIVFMSYMDGWPHLYSIAATGGSPLLLTPGNYMAEYVRLSPDGRTLVFAGNAGDTPDDLHRRHVVSVPVDRAAPRVLTPGTGLEWTPVVLSDGATVAFLGATAQRPPLPAVMQLAGGTPRQLGADRIPADFPSAQLVTPRAVSYTADDGVVVHAQLFDAGGPAGRRPAIVYVHGGPPRQMLVGWHYSDYYTHAYAMNQYLASRGYVVLSVNYRLGIGYGYEFHQPAAAGARGASEYRDVKAAALYLRGLPTVDPARIGIYGGSYGGYLTALALGRNSDLFAAGVDIHGVHDMTAGSSGAGSALQSAMSGASRFEPTDRDQALEVAWTSSPVSSVSTWRSPVLLIHGDDDRNVRFSQTVDLARRLAAQGVDYEELVIVDDTHHWMRHANQRRVDAATADYFDRKLRGAVQ
ncbi:MAG: S9 family peptidase [Gemmatimonadetes bacterium]|nr:S9 family peptidase [Gemmatimonadota bacterium]